MHLNIWNICVSQWENWILAEIVKTNRYELNENGKDCTCYNRKIVAPILFHSNKDPLNVTHLNMDSLSTCKVLWYFPSNESVEMSRLNVIWGLFNQFLQRPHYLAMHCRIRCREFSWGIVVARITTAS